MMTINKYLATKYWKRKGLHYTNPSERELKDNYYDEVFYVIDDPEGIVWEFDPELDRKEPILEMKNQRFGHMYKNELVFIGDGLYVAKKVGSDDLDLVAAGFEKIPKEVLSMETPLMV